VNVANAVSAAEVYTLGSLGTFTDTLDTNATATSIPNYDINGASTVVTTASTITIEAVQIEVDATHGNTGELAIELTSPAGTKSVLLTPYNGFINSNADLSMTFLSNAFYGENALGDWTIKVIDSELSGSIGGTLNHWVIKFYGH
jgi:subtilisin-like proprotein convertase family protein